MTPAARTPTLLAAALLITGCGIARNAYYNAWEKFGYAKRERLADSVKAARDEQDGAKTQFTSALDQFKQLTNFQGGDLEAMYNKLKGEYDTCSGKSDAVKGRIQTVRNVGSSLFSEWSGEIGQIQDESLKNSSQSLFDKTKADYDSMLTRMDAAAASMQPVLTKFNDRVLYLKSNLNAQAIGSLAGKEAELGKDIDELVKQMQASITEADQFMAKLNAK
ncbi:MAG: DUF2959 family protein [Tepidisphaeraceae bacterium]